jgi:hypothetical protein
MVLFLGWVLGQNFLHQYAKMYFHANGFVDLTIHLNRVLVLLLEPVDQPACLFCVDMHTDVLVGELGISVLRMFKI